MAEELQKDPMSRGQFLWMGALGTFVGAVLTIPPAVYVLDPAIKSVLGGRSDVPGVWKELGSVFEVPSGEPAVYRVEFPQRQTYDGGGPILGERSITNAVLVTWRDGEVPDILSGRSGGPLPEAERRDLAQRLNVMSNACTHMGCPVRWERRKKMIVCPCHGGVYDVNGNNIEGPPPRGLWRYAFEVREDGSIRVRHEFDGKPYII